MAKRRYALLALVLLAIAGGTWLLQRFLFPEGVKALEVLEVRGAVSVVGEGGGEKGLEPGAKVLPGERVRTGEAGEAIIRGAGSSTITVSERSSVTMNGVLDGIARVQVEEGSVRSRVKEGEGTGVEMRGGKENAKVTTRGGDVEVGIDAGGNLGVATHEGRATLEHGGTTRELGKGQTAIVAGGKVEVGELPTALLLEVAWPEPGKTRVPKAEVSVPLPRGSTAFVNGAPVALGPDGVARAVVDLKKGENRLELKARDIAGNKFESQSGVIELDTEAPPLGVGRPRPQ